jgi:hypothetical protein
MKEPIPKGLRKSSDWSTEEKINLNKIRNLKLIDKFNLPKDQIVIMGSSVLVLHSIIDKNDDLDLIVTRSVLNRMRQTKQFIRDFKYNKVFYRTKNKNLEAAVNFQILNQKIDKLLKRSDHINGYNFMNLRDTYKMYQILNRPKDVEKLKRLRQIFQKR